MKKIFLDCGAHDGCSLQMFSDSFPDHNEYEVYSFECDGGRFKQLSIKGLELDFSSFHPIKKAIWISNGKKLFDGWQLKDTTNIDDKDGVDEDVSSEGSCRTSLYQKSLRDDEEIDSNTRLSAQMHNKFSEKSSSMNHDQEDVKTDFTHT